MKTAVWSRGDKVPKERVAVIIRAEVYLEDRGRIFGRKVGTYDMTWYPIPEGRN
jgi:hypothetical protein